MLNKFYLDVITGKELTESDLLKLYVAAYKDKQQETDGVETYEPLEEFIKNLSPSIIAFDSRSQLETFCKAYPEETDGKEALGIKRLLFELRKDFEKFITEEKSPLAKTEINAWYENGYSIIYNGITTPITMSPASYEALEEALSHIIDEL